MTPIPPLKQPMKYAVPTVLPLLLFRYGLKPDALLRENQAALLFFLVVTVVYWFIAGAVKKNDNYYLRFAALALGIQSILCLLSMFVSYPFSLLPLLIFPTALALFLTYTCIRQRNVTVIGKLNPTNGQRCNLQV